MASTHEETEKPESSALADHPAVDDGHVKGTEEESTEAMDAKKSWDFWVIIAVMCTASFASALDTTIITTALPQVSNSIGGSEQYVWIANSFVFASTVFQPLYGQLSNIFGRRIPMLFAMSVFILGAGIGGGSSSVGMLIAGRTVQGIGSAGLFVLSDIIVCDLVPLRERAKFVGIVLSSSALATMVGPIIGGALAQANWRWCFYINLPIAGPSLILMFFFLKLKHKPDPSWKSSLARVDFLGNLIFIPSTLALLLGLVLGGTTFPWSSWRIILPIVLGGVGWIVFHVHQASPLCREPSVPPRLFTNRTTCTAFVLSFIGGMMLNWITYFLIFYFQSVKAATPLLSAVYTLPLFLVMLPAAIMSGGILSKTGQYKPLHWVGFGLVTLSVGLFSILDSTSNPAEWVFFQIFASLGLGPIMTALLPSVLAGLPESDVATATATFSFLRCLGFVWGITIPSIVFNNEFNNHLGLIGSSSLRNTLSNGAAFGYAVSGNVRDLSGTLLRQVTQAYSLSVSQIWHVAIAFPLLGFLLVFVEKHITLRTELETEYGIDAKNGKQERTAESKAETGEAESKNE